MLGLLNASLRPLILLGAMSLGIIAFTLIAFALNAVVVVLASNWLPGFAVDGWGSAFVVAFGLAALNGLFTGLLSLNDQDTLYRNVTRRLARRRAGGAVDQRPGLAIVQIDGLAEAVLREELADGQAAHPGPVGGLGEPPPGGLGVRRALHDQRRAGRPVLRRQQRHPRLPLVRQGRRHDVRLQQPGGRPGPGRPPLGRRRRGGGLLADGVSISNLLTGGAGQSTLTMAGLVTDAGKRQVNTRDFYTYLANPYNLTRGLLGFFGDVLVEYWEAWRSERRKDEPRMHRGGSFPYLRAATTTIMRDAAVWMTVDAMHSGRRVAYMDFLGYDEIAHHAGHEIDDARRVLRRFDSHLAALKDAAARAPGPTSSSSSRTTARAPGRPSSSATASPSATWCERLIAEGGRSDASGSPPPGRRTSGRPAATRAGGTSTPC